METKTFELNVQEVQVIFAALVDLPYKVSAPVIAKMEAQMKADNGEDGKEDD